MTLKYKIYVNWLSYKRVTMKAEAVHFQREAHAILAQKYIHFPTVYKKQNENWLKTQEVMSI